MTLSVLEEDENKVNMDLRKTDYSNEWSVFFVAGVKSANTFLCIF